MTAPAPAGLLAEARKAGVSVTLDPAGDLKVKYAGERPAAILAKLKANKPAVAALLSGRTPELCAGCGRKCATPDRSPELVALGELCGWGDCPYRAAAPAPAGQVPPD